MRMIKLIRFVKASLCIVLLLLCFNGKSFGLTIQLDSAWYASSSSYADGVDHNNHITDNADADLDTGKLKTYAYAGFTDDLVGTELSVPIERTSMADGYIHGTLEVDGTESLFINLYHEISNIKAVALSACAMNSFVFSIGDVFYAESYQGQATCETFGCYYELYPYDMYVKYKDQEDDYAGSAYSSSGHNYYLFDGWFEVNLDAGSYEFEYALNSFATVIIYETTVGTLQPYAVSDSFYSANAILTATLPDDVVLDLWLSFRHPRTHHHAPSRFRLNRSCRI